MPSARHGHVSPLSVITCIDDFPCHVYPKQQMVAALGFFAIELFLALCIGVSAKLCEHVEASF